MNLVIMPSNFKLKNKIKLWVKKNPEKGKFSILKNILNLKKTSFIFVHPRFDIKAKNMEHIKEKYK